MRYVPVHGQVVVDTMEQEVQHEEEWLVGQPVVDVEQKAMHPIFNQGPNQHSQGPACARLDERIEGEQSEVGHGEEGLNHEWGQGSGELEDRTDEHVHGDGCPDKGDYIPRGTCEDLKEA